MKMKLLLFLITLGFVCLDLTAHDLEKLERSFWLNASLAAPKRGYWGTEFQLGAACGLPVNAVASIVALRAIKP